MLGIDYSTFQHRDNKGGNLIVQITNSQNVNAPASHDSVGLAGLSYTVPSNKSVSRRRESLGGYSRI